MGRARSTGAQDQGASRSINPRTRGPSFGIRVPPANQSWPILVNGLLLYSDDRSGNLDLYAIRTANVRYQRGNEIPIVKE